MASSAIRISALDFKSRKRNLAFELNSQDRAGFEPDVVAFGHQHAAEHARPDAARETAKPAARPSRDYSAERAKTAADASVPSRASARMSAADFAFVVLGFQLVVVGVIVNSDNGD